jgi:hypothetical protein
MDVTKSAGPPALFYCAMLFPAEAAAHRLIVTTAGPMLEGKMVPDQTSVTCRRGARIVIDDHSRLPSRFFGRFTTSATSVLLRMI